jgi:hypothetical protein
MHIQSNITKTSLDHVFKIVKKNILLTRCASSLKYCFHHSKIKVISSRRRVISSIYFTTFNRFKQFIEDLKPGEMSQCLCTRFDSN